MPLPLKILLVIIALILIYVVYAFFRTRHYINIGNGLADAAVKYEQHPENPTVRILTIGDSSVVGTGASKPQESVAGYLGAKYPHADITNIGVNGAKTMEIAPRLASFADQRFDLVLIHAGGNDIVRFTKLSEVEESVRAILQEATKLSDNVIILHGGDVGTARLFPAGTRWLFTRRTHQVREIFLRLTKKFDVHYIDLWRKDANDPFFEDPKRFYAADWFHPSSHGYKDWFDHIEPVLDTLPLRI